MKKIVFTNIMAAVCIAAIFAAGAHAASLTDEKIRNFIASWDEIQEIGEEYDDLDDLDDEAGIYGDEEMATMPERPMSHAIERMRGHEIHNRVDNTVQGYGFSDINEWGDVGDRVIKAFFSLQIEEESPEMRAQMEQAMREIEQSPMPDAQKEQMKQRMRSQMEAVEAMADAPEEDIEAVRPHMEELRRELE